METTNELRVLSVEECFVSKLISIEVLKVNVTFTTIVHRSRRPGHYMIKEFN